MWGTSGERLRNLWTSLDFKSTLTLQSEKFLGRGGSGRSRENLQGFGEAGGALTQSVDRKFRGQRKLGDPQKLGLGCTPRGSCNRTLLRRFLKRFSNSKCF